MQAAVLAPQHVTLVEASDIDASSFDAVNTVVLFPAEDAMTPEELDTAGVRRLVIIDSRWYARASVPAIVPVVDVGWCLMAGPYASGRKKATELMRRQSLLRLRCVRLDGTARSCFWRYHTKGTADEGVCSIEALFFLLRHLCKLVRRSDIA